MSVLNPRQGFVASASLNFLRRGAGGHQPAELLFDIDQTKLGLKTSGRPTEGSLNTFARGATCVLVGGVQHLVRGRAR